MPAVGFSTLGSLKVTRVVQMLRDARDPVRAPMIFSDRLPKVNASDGDLMGRFVGNIYIADLIALDAQAVTYKAGEFKFESSKSPKIKTGRHMTESQTKEFLELFGGMAPPTEGEVVQFFGPMVEHALTGIDWRIEYLATAMLLDSFNYDRLGYKAHGVTWGMPSDFKVTFSVPWTDAANAEPVDDILYQKRYYAERYGREFTRLTMSRQAFRYMIATAEFQAKAKVYLPTTLTFDNLGLNREMDLQGLAERTLDGLSIEFADHRYHYQNPDGSEGSARFLPANKVIFDSPQSDNNVAVRDVAKGRVVEPALIPFAGSSIIGAGGISPNMQYGPVSYIHVPPGLNPPMFEMWAVDAAWPRKHDIWSNAVFTVGSFSDSIPIADPAF